MNIALVVGSFAALFQALDVPFRFPGTERAYRQLVQFTDADLLARASNRAATAPRAGGEALNVTNGDVFRWERMWEDAARNLGLTVVPPVSLTLARHMADKGPAWRGIAQTHGLVQPNLGKLVGWDFGDFIFHTENDVISNVNKIARFGFTERMDSTASLLGALDRLQERRALPPMKRATMSGSGIAGPEAECH